MYPYITRKKSFEWCKISPRITLIFTNFIGTSFLITLLITLRILIKKRSFLLKLRFSRIVRANDKVKGM